MSDRVARRTANALVAGCLLVLVGTAGAFLVPAVRAYFSRGASRTIYRVGEQLDVPAGVYRGSARTLLLFTRASCAGCVAAQPALKEIVESLRPAGVAIRLIVSDGSDQAEARQYAAGIGLDQEAVRRVDFSKLHFTSVPLAVLADETGRVLFVQEGTMSPERRHDLLGLVSASAATH